MKLSAETAEPVAEGAAPLSRAAAEELLREIPLWVLGDGTIRRELRFKDFRAAMVGVNRIADVANAQNHHPDMAISYNKVQVTLSTHRIGGLSKNDFIVATKIDLLEGV